MLKIRRFACENMETLCVTDSVSPRFSFSTESDRAGAKVCAAHLTVGNWHCENADQIAQPYPWLWHQEYSQNYGTL